MTRCRAGIFMLKNLWQPIFSTFLSNHPYVIAYRPSENVVQFITIKMSPIGQWSQSDSVTMYIQISKKFFKAERSRLTIPLKNIASPQKFSLFMIFLVKLLLLFRKNNPKTNVHSNWINRTLKPNFKPYHERTYLELLLYKFMFHY